MRLVVSRKLILSESSSNEIAFSDFLQKAVSGEVSGSVFSCSDYLITTVVAVFLGAVIF